MTLTVNGTLFKSQINNTDMTATAAEQVIDAAINLLNTFGADVDNLTGTAGTKTGSYTSAETGAIITLSQQVYARFYCNPEQTNSESVSNLNAGYTSDNQLLKMAKTLADELIRVNREPPIYIANTSLS